MQISELKGKTCTRVWATEDEVHFETTDGKHYKLYHQDDCCEVVDLDDVAGDLDDLVGEPLIMVEEVNNEPDRGARHEYDSSYTWTFYKLATAKGYVTLRFYGTSNGYYSESVDFEQV